MPPWNKELGLAFRTKILKTDTCWIWTGYIQPKGYGVFAIYGVNYLAHRIAYWRKHPEFDPRSTDNTTVDHKCCNKACVRPSHLRLLSRGENSSIGNKKEFCNRGHPMIPENLYINSNGSRRCKQCVTDRNRARH